jgi:UDP-N-acetylmuramyl pentapeptide phosphotransferase/UDP-N-acetylglucosamine-1-phosphate transferase
VTSASGIALFLAAVAVSYGLLFWLHPLLARYALAKPNVRSSHSIPTPQGGGIAVVTATLLLAAGATIWCFPGAADPFRLAAVFVAVAGLAVVGATDDMRPLHVVPRLALQAAAVAVVVYTIPPEMRIIPAVPWWLDRAIVFVGGVWLVNAVNFMDGIDWMTVVEIVPVTAALALFGLIGALPADATMIALTLCGAMVGFAPFNRPVANLFLGDVGSLPIGLLLTWLLALLAGQGHLAAALLLPFYYLADATITLLRRFASGQPVTQAHRSHFYQRALDGGLSVYEIVARVFATNIVLAALAALSVLCGSLSVTIAALAAGAAVVGTLLWTLSRSGIKDPAQGRT